MYGYRYSGEADAVAQFVTKADQAGQMEIRYAYGSHENRGKHMPVTVSVGGKVERQLKVDLTKPAPLENGMISLGTYRVSAGARVEVKVEAGGAGGLAHIDAVQFLPVK